MAEIEVERKSHSWIWWVIGIIILALIAWALLAGDDEEEIAVTPAPIEEPAMDPPPPEPVAQGPASLGDLLGNPAGYIGQTLELAPAEVQVAEVPSDGGFWVEDGGARVFVIINEPPPPGADESQQNEPLNIQPGQTVRIREAVAQDPTFITSLRGEISPESTEILESEPVYLVTDWGNVQIVDGQ